MLSFRDNFKKDMKRFDHHIADLRKQLVGRYAAVEKVRPHAYSLCAFFGPRGHTQTHSRPSVQRTTATVEIKTHNSLFLLTTNFHSTDSVLMPLMSKCCLAFLFFSIVFISPPV